MCSTARSNACDTTGQPARPAARGESGQAAVEFAIVLPIVLTFALGIVQVGIALRNELAVELAARAGARAASVTSDAASAASRRRDTVGRPARGHRHHVGDRDVTVTATYVDDTDVAIIGVFIGPVTHTASVTMALEPP